jgi:NitT/TauT family transport system permease protein/taurine transport system permease protein
MGTGKGLSVAAAPPVALSPAQLRRSASAVGGALLPFAVLVVAWQALAMTGLLPRNMLPSAVTVGQAIWDLLSSGALVDNTFASLARLSIGLVVSVPLGVGLGLLAGMNTHVAELVEPPASFLNALSGIAWIPLAIAWFGIGPVAVTFIISNSIFFLVFFNTVVGVRRVPHLYEQAVLTLGADRWRIARDVFLPGALPSIVSGARLGVSFGWRALIAAEMLGASSGLGFLLFSASYFFQTDVVLAGIAVIGTISVLTDRLVFDPIERATITRWGLTRREAA